MERHFKALVLCPKRVPASKKLRAVQVIFFMTLK
jgi:hypothetical protein